MAGESEKRQGATCLDNGTNRRIAKRAQEYIEEHYPYAIRMEDLCRCTGVSMRTVQRSFSDYFQMSPFEYIKARRLNAVRQALVAADSSRDRVTLIALNNGFTHLGRFSVDYREHFGESPSETLARRWRGGTGGRGRKCRVASRAGGCISTLHCDSGGGRFPAIRPKHPHG